MKEEALKLADELEALHQYVPSEAPAMIRRLVEELDKQGEHVAWVDSIGTFVTDSDYKELPERLKEDMIPLYTTPQTKPLSDEEITQLKAEIVAHKKTNELLAQKIEQLEKELTK